jgi:diacylglycerol diphosphate phosphatase/phosphatidate phosphatase
VGVELRLVRTRSSYLTAVRGSWYDIRYYSTGYLKLISHEASLKNLIGKPRPDLVDRCQPIQGSTDPVLGLSNSTICTQTDNAILKDGFRSFPSGHSSSKWNLCKRNS